MRRAGIMKVTALMENTSAREDCVAEFGLSFLVEANGRSVLFDAGQSDKTVSNAVMLGIDLNEVDVAILSHGHFDHADGFPAFLKVNSHAPLYVRTGYDGKHYGGDGRFIGVVDELVGNNRLKVIDDARLNLGDGFTIVSYAQSEPAFPIDHAGLLRKDGEDLVPDTFEHEQCLLIEEDGVRLLITGCTHRGIRNVMRWSAGDTPTNVVGGFHFMRVPMDDTAFLDEAADDLLSFPVDYATCHCTGLDQYRYLKERMGDRLSYIAAGQTIEL